MSPSMIGLAKEAAGTVNKGMRKCGEVTEVYTRCCGYFRPVASFNRGKKNEVRDRKMFSINYERLAKNASDVS